ncbi:MAG: phosphomethylpyrimidine synthase [Candidatus Altiarchaeales archaeon ex4484_96]|nr:MAG: phosphomethylpyrimidine synthase [Candidatus Altiarchaeales archaeon ex4484_96]
MFSELARSEGLSEEKLKRRVREGWIVLVKNAKRDIKPLAIGTDTRVKVNANIGYSPDCMDEDKELLKAKAAMDSGADTLMDLSVGEHLDDMRRKIIKRTTIPVGTVPIYQAFIEKKTNMSREDILKVIERNCMDGVDFVTLHCGITLDMVNQLPERLIPVTSRGGSFLAAWMIINGRENPLYEYFDDVLEIVKEYEVVISLGDALRPACLHDASDELQFKELFNLGRLTKKARKAGVPIIIEGPGHVPLDQIEYNVRMQKRICDNSPFYVLGPLVTDIALGFDHISGAIGGALAAMHGADFLCYVTPSEHMGLPNIDDVKKGVVASKIAAHAADIVRLGDRKDDDLMSAARGRLDWETMFKLGLDKEIKKRYPNLSDKKECSMCGKYCALKIVREHLRKK